MTMEKEIEIAHEHLSFYYEGEEFERLNETLNSLSHVFQQFLSGSLGHSSKNFSLNISLCSNERILQLNSDYRDKPKVTDVLSFPVQDNLRNSEFDDYLPLIELGDIFICEDVCQKQADEFKLEFREEFIHLAVHGFLHLCGYDHELNETEEKLMEKLEEELILKIKPHP